MASRARAAGMELYTCATERDYSTCGAPPGACIDAAWIRDSLGLVIPDKKDPGQRPQCRCAVSRDIGTNDTCAHGCLYCYANPACDRRGHE